MTATQFAVSVTTDDTTGAVISAYFQIRAGEVHTTREYADGAAFADFNRDGELIGVELLAPCNVSIVEQIAANEDADFRRQAMKFLREAGPRQLVAV